MSDNFLGVGWTFRKDGAAKDGAAQVGVDANGQIALAPNEESIQQAIWMILGTAPGERVMRPDFGCGIHDLVFAVNSAGTAGQMASLVRQSLVRWEPT